MHKKFPMIFIGTILLYLLSLCHSNAQTAALDCVPASPPVVIGMPYSAIRITTETSRNPNDNLSTRTQTCFEWRDAEGRTREEDIQVSSSGQEIRIVNINDPVAHVHYSWKSGKNAEREVVRSRLQDEGTGSPASHDPSLSLPPSKMTAQHSFIAPEDHDAESAGRVHSLDMAYMEGLYVEGTRIVRMVPAGSEGNDRDITIVSETWQSPDLKIIIQSSYNDPRIGNRSLMRIHIDQSNPDPALFQPPAGYHVQNMNAAVQIH